MGQGLGRWDRAHATLWPRQLNTCSKMYYRPCHELRGYCRPRCRRVLRTTALTHLGTCPPPTAQIWQLLRFLAGVMALEKPLLVSAYLLMLAALLFRLCLPRVEAAIFDAFNDLDTQLFKQQLKMWAGEAGRGDGRWRAWGQGGGGRGCLGWSAGMH